MPPRVPANPRSDPLLQLQSVGWNLSLTLALFLFCGIGSAAEARPSPLSVPASSEWIGYDGTWNPVSIRVGSPPQWLEVIPNTGAPETWAIGRGGCDSTMRCRRERGGLFLSNESSTWTDVGLYELGHNVELGDDGVGYYGYDNIALDEQTSVPDQVIGIVNTTDSWLGTLGLGIITTNFTDKPALSFISSLVQNQSLIPSHSYGYTAGANHQLKGVPSSLTLGGVDKNRFVQNDVSFALPSDDIPTVAIKSIKMSTTIDSAPKSDDTLTSAGNADTFRVDSTTPFFWFPERVCDSFAENLGLTYNDTLQLYTYGSNVTKYEELVDAGYSFTFTISDLPDSSNSIDITLPFAAFDQILSFPFPNLDADPDSNGTRYFPLRKAKDSEEYTIGRTFLQEAYLTVDYERRNFSISQAKFAADSGVNMDLVEITSPSDSPLPSPTVPKESKLSVGTKAGIGVGVSAGVILIVLCVVFWFRRKKRKALLDPEKKYIGARSKFFRRFRRPPPSSSSNNNAVELLADRRHPLEAPAGASVTRFELPGDQAVELEGSEVVNSDIQKVEVEANGPRENPRNILPAYSASDSGQTDTDTSRSYIVSPVVPSSTQCNSASIRTQSVGMPSPITSSAENSTSGSYSRTDGSSNSHINSHLNVPVHTVAEEPVTEQVSQNDESEEEPDRRKFSWEE